MTPETAFVGLDESHLTDGRRSLQFTQGDWPFRPTQTLHTLGDGAAGDQHDFLALLDQRGDLARPARQAGQIEAAAVIGDQAAADLDDDARGEGDDGLSHSCSMLRFISSRCSWMA